MINRLVLLLFLGSFFMIQTSSVDASWLSKAWGRYKHSNEQLLKEQALPTYDDYAAVRLQRGWVGVELPDEDMSIAGIVLGSSESSLNSLGPAQWVEKKPRWTIYHYGSIQYFVEAGLIKAITVSARDAVTYRGIAVGDPLTKVYDLYGKPVNIKSNKTCVYGRYINFSGVMHVLEFETNGKKVTKISLTSQ